MKAATTDSPDKAQYRKISIHAAREGGDAEGLKRNTKREISIHAAREGGDAYMGGGVAAEAISIHAAREGGDPAATFSDSVAAVFQSTPPVKAATWKLMM